MWAYGALVEAAGWLCLGSDLGYFPRRGMAEVLRPLFDTNEVRALRSGRRLVEGSDWAVHLAVGDVDQALEVRPFRDLSAEDAAALQPAFQSAWSFAARLAASAPLNRFLERLLVLHDALWHLDILGARKLSEAGRTRDPAAWQPLAEGHPLDGLIATLHHLQVLATWAASTAEAESPGESARPSPEGAEPGPAESPARRLVQSAGKLLRWRLDLGNQQVSQRLEQAIDLADRRLPELMTALGYDIEDAWPEGFRAAMAQALADWDRMSGGATRGRPTPPTMTGGGGEAAKPAPWPVGVAVGAGVGSFRG